MLLVIDVGNTNMVIGVFDGDNLIKDWRIRTERNRTADEFGVLASNLITGSGINMIDIKKTVISSVVPPVAAALDLFCKKYFSHAPIWVDAKSSANMPILYTNPDEVGADRIVNSIAAYEKYKTSLIVIDFGTATTFDAISSKGEYIGGAITPGIMISADALFMKASKLPRVDLMTPPEKVIGRDTLSSIKSGIIYGCASLVDGMVKRMSEEMGSNPKIIATGGLAEIIKNISGTIESIEPDLTLEGLKIISNNI
ncbi:MAG: type III pantothenate kinase [Desulfobacterales bacterium]|jgi:type III pantothenate kinase|nr:type III pantothenate kinase [Desulfobacteraceae bacterium]MBT4363390.1 type III pantothenate kinase [Desulfobacteraceae bacterium]MBT7085297.1 type III pantothenate kinase [Desulfobacterales bacterium]MBT7696159.1 type III pantothenate kinase [Desulfobacterales bacterium]